MNDYIVSIVRAIHGTTNIYQNIYRITAPDAAKAFTIAMEDMNKRYSTITSYYPHICVIKLGDNMSIALELDIGS